MTSEGAAATGGRGEGMWTTAQIHRLNLQKPLALGIPCVLGFQPSLTRAGAKDHRLLRQTIVCCFSRLVHSAICDRLTVAQLCRKQVLDDLMTVLSFATCNRQRDSGGAGGAGPRQCASRRSA